MNPNIDISLLNNYFTNKTEKGNKNNKKEKTQSKSKIIPYCFFSINEINIVNIIDKIPYNSNYYNIMIDYDFIDIGKIGENIIENIKLNNNKQYIITHYNNEKYIDFQDFLFNNSDKKQFLFNILNSYSRLLNSLITLNDTNVCFFDLNTYNIVFLENSMPILQNFQNGLIISQLNESYIKQIIVNTEIYTYKPLEIHVLFYLIINEQETLSFSLIESICENYVKNMYILNFFSQKYKESYKKECVETLKKYINVPKTEIISDILKYYKYWDNYSLTIIYLHIFGNISRFFTLRNTFINNFTLILTKNIHPNPLKRETLKETSKKYHKLFNEFTDWSFINNVSNEKLQNLYDYLVN
jgi:hypothetical protein